MGDAQRTALERALDHDGKVSRTDYMAAWSNYRQCMVDKGYNEPPLHMVNGLVVELMHFDFSGMSDQQQTKFHQDQSACLEQESLYVASVYSDSIVNPELYVDLDVAMVDCLRRHELVPVEYTVAQYRKESTQFTDMTFDGENLTQQQSYERRRKAYSFDFSDPQVRTCVAGVNASAIVDELEPWKPFG